MNAEADGLKNFSPEHPLILLTDYPPDVAGGGAVILRDLLGPEERERVIWASLTPSQSTVLNSHGLQSGSAGSAGNRSIVLDSTVHARALTNEVEQLVRDRHARAVWIVMHNAAVPISARLTERKSVPIHLTVHDDPAFANALRSRRYLAMVPLLARDFARSLRRATSIDVICEAMRKRYAERYGVDSVIVHRGLSGPIGPSPLCPADVLRVGVLGSTYAYDQLPILGRAVHSAAQNLGVPGEIVVIGKSYGERLRVEMRGLIDVKVTGHVEESSAISLLQSCFILYLNYPFGWRDRVLRQTSFPTKLSTYIQASRPLLLHLPSDSSVVPLIGPDRFATPWHSLNEAEGAAALTSLWHHPASHESWHANAEDVRTRYYDRVKNRQILFTTLNALIS